MQKSLAALVTAAAISLGTLGSSLYAQTPTPQAPIGSSQAVKWEPWPRPRANGSQTPTPQAPIPRFRGSLFPSNIYGYKPKEPVKNGSQAVKWEPWPRLDNINLPQLNKPTPQEPVKTPCEIENISSLKVTKQEDTRDCAVGLMKTSLDQIVIINNESGLKRTSYEEVRSGLRNKKYSSLNHGDYISFETVILYFNSLPKEQRGDWMLEKEQGTSLSDLRRSLEETRMPVMVAYMRKIFTGGTVGFINPAVKWLPRKWAEGIIGGERYIFEQYLHAGEIVKIEDGKDNDQIVYMVDPWDGYSILSGASKGIEKMKGKDFVRSWLSYDQQFPWFERGARKLYHREIKPIFERLAPPGSYLVFRKENAKKE